MNAVLNSNSSSAIVSAIDSVKPYNPFVYSLGKKSQIQGGNVPAHARTSVRSNPQSTPAFNTATDFKIIRGGMLENCILRLEFAVANAEVVVSGTFFNDICERIQLISSGRVIQETTAFGRMCLLSSRPKDVRDNYTDLMQLTNGDKALAVGSYVAYIPCMFSHFESPELHLNDLFCEPLMVRLRLAGVADFMLSSDTASNMTITASGVYLQHITITGNGQEIIKLDGDMLKFGLVPAMDLPNSPYGAGGGNDTLPAISNIYCFSLGYTTDNSHYTNLNSLREINSYKVVVNLASAASGNHRLRVALQCPVLESISASSGKITTSLSS